MTCAGFLPALYYYAEKIPFVKIHLGCAAAQDKKSHSAAITLKNPLRGAQLSKGTEKQYYRWLICAASVAELEVQVQ
jgi:hypothetical protein